MLPVGIIVVCFENPMKAVNALRGRSEEFINVKLVGM
jgi:hypothetical protein